MAQVEIEGKLIFTSPADSLKQIYGIAPADSLNDVLTQNDFAYKKYFDTEVSIADSTFYITTNFEYPTLSIGASLLMKIPLLTDTVNVPFMLKINNETSFPIRTVNTSIIGTETIKSNRLLMLLFTGTEFICINTPVFRCPAGFKQMNENYCIQTNRNPLATFWNANKNCNDQGYHLCTFQEWYYACTHNAGLSQMPLNFEWVHSTSNHNVHALKVGNGSSCTGLDSETTAVTGLPMYFRCCYSLK